MAKKKKKSEEEEEETGGKKKPMMIGGAIVAAVVVYKFVLAPAPVPVEEGAIDEMAERVLEEGEIFPLSEIVVNLTDTDENRYLRVGIALVLEKGTTAATMELETAVAVDAIIDYLSAQSMADLREPGSKTTVREDLSENIRAAYDDSKVVRVLLTTFVMQ
jgi:flagellar basal body-associated protein FliL